MLRATVSYFDPALARGRFDLVEPERNQMSFEPHDVAIHDMRSAGEPLSLDAQGFLLTSHSSRVAHTTRNRRDESHPTERQSADQQVVLRRAVAVAP